MIGKATVFAFLLLAPGIAFAADSAATAAAPAHDTASAATSTKPDVKTDGKQTVVKAKTHHKAKKGADAVKPAEKS